CAVPAASTSACGLRAFAPRVIGVSGCCGSVFGAVWTPAYPGERYTGGRLAVAAAGSAIAAKPMLSTAAAAPRTDGKTPRRSSLTKLFPARDRSGRPPGPQGVRPPPRGGPRGAATDA